MHDNNGHWWRGRPLRPLPYFLAHLLITSLMFSAVLVLAWCVSYLVAWLHQVHPFPPETYRFLTSVKRWLVYFDVALLAAGLLSSATRFIKETWEAP